MNLTKINTPFTFLIFGASGDLAKLHIFPALYDLAFQGRLKSTYRIVGYGRSPKSNEALQHEFKTSVEKIYGERLNKKILDTILPHITYVTGQYDHRGDFAKLTRHLKKIGHRHAETLIAYYATPPSVFEAITERLAEIENKVSSDLRLVLEKPLGTDEASATHLFHFISRLFREERVYLLDHYLGKEAVQSILSLRYNNRILDHLLSGDLIHQIQITASESSGVEDRIGYFEQVGMLRDMIQSHLLQILAFLTMELPIYAKSENLQREKHAVLSALNLSNENCNIALGQYAGYREQRGVKKNSHTETFAALRFFIDRAKWYRIPIYIRTGKKLDHKHTYIVIEFKKSRLQKHLSGADANRIVIELFPNEKLEIHLVNQQGDRTGYQKMISAESLACTGDECLDPHARLILNVLASDRSYFLSFPEVIACWRFIDRVSAAIKQHKIPVNRYGVGSEGPSTQHKLTERDGNEWYHID